MESDGDSGIVIGEEVGGGLVAVPRQDRVVVEDGVNLAVRAWDPPAGRSRGVPFVLLHGIASSSVAWDGVARKLAGAGRAAYARDLRGHGLSETSDDGDPGAGRFDLATLAADLVAVLGALRLNRPILVGHSLGANVILEAVAAGAVAAQFAGLPMASSPIAGGVGLVEGGLVDAGAQFATLEECLARMALPPVAGMPLPHLQAYLRRSNPTWSGGQFAAAMAAFNVHADGTVSWRLTAARQESLLRALWAARVADRWPAVHVPALCVVADTGDADWTAARKAAVPVMERAIPGVRIEWLTAEHDVHTSRPDEVADLLLEAFPPDQSTGTGRPVSIFRPVRRR